MDLVSHYRTRATGIEPVDTEACVTGETFDGTPIRACDNVTVRERGIGDTEVHVVAEALDLCCKSLKSLKDDRCSQHG